MKKHPIIEFKFNGISFNAAAIAAKALAAWLAQAKADFFADNPDQQEAHLKRVHELAVSMAGPKQPEAPAPKAPAEGDKGKK